MSGIAMLSLIMNPDARAEEGQKRLPPPLAEEIAKLPKDGGPEFNRLVFEQSPYLLQHARNPVDWWPWGEEAFKAAKDKDKPVFLSIGYATCHWCHVMEHESFEDPAVAKLLNDKFLCIKVDREEMPHVDQVYMTVTQGMNEGRGGWPMSVAMTADQEPFFAGTYFPKAGFTQIMENINKIWDTDRAKLLESAGGITKQLRAMATSAAGDLPDVKVLDAALAYTESTYDSEFGGFGGPPRYAPKFPSPHDYSLLVRHYKRTGSKKALGMVSQSLKAMRHGGMYDQIGFGTHRYATDRKWLVPHFEKMLYDQALLAIANIDAYQATGDDTFKHTAEEIFTYVLRDMQDPGGAFYCAEDADSEGEEGKFYVWEHEEILKILGKDEGTFFANVYNIQSKGNWVDEATNEPMKTNIPHLTQSIAELAKKENVKESDLRKRLDESRTKLFAVREKRIHPLKDDKILTDWNGLMIAALARGGIAFGNESYTKEARRAADFVLTKMRGEKGRLVKRYRAGEAGLEAHLEDYAYLLWGLVELYEASFEPNYLLEAKGLAQTLFAHYWDADNGGFFMTADDGEKLIVRNKEVYDGAQPSGNSVAALNLLRLSRLTGEVMYEEKAKETIKAFGTELAERPAGFSVMLQAVDFLLADTREIVVVGKAGAEDTKKMLAAIQQRFDPHKVVIFKPEGQVGEVLSAITPYVALHTALEGKATAYVCQNFACKLPQTDLAKVMESLK
ncbi:MAG: hypothetical protein ACI9DF_002359 [Verrucomicrobiales bacterium]|jgi:uncharacterized protein YyaL (SSP411 family)